MKKKFVVFANCQSRAVALTLMENKHFSDEYEWLVIPAVQNITFKCVESVLDAVHGADLFIYQPVASSGNRPAEISSDFLLGQLKPGCLSISFPSVYFDGYFPHLASLMGINSVLNLAHDYVVAYAVALGFSDQQVVDFILSDDFYSARLSQDLLSKSVDSLKFREEQDKIDILLSEYISSNYQSTRLFNQFNHPKRPLIKFVADRVLEILGLEHPYVDVEGVSHLDTIYIPVYPSIYKSLSLEFDEVFDIYVNGKDKYDIFEVVAGYRSSYMSIDPAVLIQNVLQKKPFIESLF